MLRGQYAHSVGCFHEAAFHFMEATKVCALIVLSWFIYDLHRKCSSNLNASTSVLTRKLLVFQLTESKTMQSMCQVYAAVSYICIGDAESSSQVKFPLK